MTSPIALPVDALRKYAARSFGAAAIVSLVLGGCAVEAPSTSPSSPGATTGEQPVVDKPAPTDPANPAGTGEKVEVAIDNSVGGSVELTDGTKLEIPAGALPPGVEKISVVSSPSPAPSAYAAVSPVYEFGPDGTVFLKPLKVEIPFTLRAGQSVDNLTVLWSRPSGPGFDMVPTQFAGASTAGGKTVAVGEVMHFSQGLAGAKFSVDPFPPKDPYQ